MRFCQIDKVLEVAPGEFARALKNITYNEEQLQFHFPDYPVYPGTLLVEAAAQLSGFLFEVSVNRDPEKVKRAVLMQIDRAKFHQAVRPGDCLEILSRNISQLGDAGQFAGTISVERKEVASFSLNFMLMQVAYSGVHKQQRSLYQQWTRGLNLNFPLL